MANAIEWQILEAVETLLTADGSAVASYTITKGNPSALPKRKYPAINLLTLQESESLTIDEGYNLLDLDVQITGWIRGRIDKNSLGTAGNFRADLVRSELEPVFF